MATIAVFHSVLGLRPGVHDAVDRLRAAGHEVHAPDLYEGRTFDAYDEAMAFGPEGLGFAELVRRAHAAVAGLPDGFLTLGFSFGCVPAVHLATTRSVRGVVMLAGVIPASGFGPGSRWPDGVAAQTHQMVDDPWREAEELEQAQADIAAAAGVLEVFDYPGSGHLFMDPSLPAEHDPAATELMWSRVLPFLDRHG